MILYSYEDKYDDEENDSYAWQDFKDNVKYELNEVFIYPIQLEAQNSNWRGQAGYAEVEDFKQLMQKVESFDSSFLELHKENDEYYFKLATHDVPTGFNIYITQG